MKRLTAVAVVLTVAFAALGAPSAPQARSIQGASPAEADLRQVNGPLWSASTTAEKRAYLIGIANALTLSKGMAARERGEDPAYPLNRMNSALCVQTIDDGIAEIDAWYKANPSRGDLPVLGVIYLRMVKGE